MANTVIRKAYVNVQLVDLEAAAAITPGYLVERTSAGKVQAHSTDAGPNSRLFAIEDSFQGKKITDDYATGDMVVVRHFTPGEQVYAICGGDSSESISIGDYVRSAGDGTLEKFSELSGDSGGASTAGEIVGEAVEAATFGDRFTVEII